MKIIIIGNSGAGKSLLAKRISKHYSIKHYNLDNIFWCGKQYKKSNPYWKIKKKIKSISETEEWVIEGVYTHLLKLVIIHADILIWLDICKNACISNIHRRDIKPTEFQIKRIKEYYTREIGSSYNSHLKLWKNFINEKYRFRKSVNHVGFLKGVRNMSSIKFFLNVLWILIKFAFRHQENFKPIVKSIFLYNKKIRISVAAILLLEENERFVLIKNHHRPELFGPIGGVYKHSGQKPEIFTNIEWDPDYTFISDKKEDMKDDIRGVISGKHFPIFIEWFSKRQGRESEQGLYRELKEELKEGRIGKIFRDKSSDIKTELFRSVLEGPNKVSGNNYTAQFRHFDIFKLDITDEVTKSFKNELIGRALRGENNLILASKEDILIGRLECGEKLIAPHTKYYFSTKWHGQEPQKYLSKKQI